MPLEHRLNTAKEAADELRMKLPLAKHCEKIKKFPLRDCLWAVFLSKNPNLLTFFVDPEANFAAPKKTKNPVTIEITGFFLVGVARLELAASWSRTMRATICATPRCSFFIIMISSTVVKQNLTFRGEIFVDSCFRKLCIFLLFFLLTAAAPDPILKMLRSALSCKLC